MDIHDESIFSQPESEMMVDPELNEIPAEVVNVSFVGNEVTGLESGVNEIEGSDIEKVPEELSPPIERTEVGHGAKVSFCKTGE